MTRTSQIAQAAARVERAPSTAQIEAGNYRKGHFVWNGLHIVIENPKGGTRSGIDVPSKPWETTIRHNYGYVRSTDGADGDPVNVFMGPHSESEHVFVIDQRDPETGAFDEHKVMLGFHTEQVAKGAYRRDTRFRSRRAQGH